MISHDKETNLISKLKLNSIPHGERNAEIHGIGVSRILKELKLPDHVITAGMFHYLYGAESYPELSVPGATRTLIKRCLGEKVEKIIYNYSLVGEVSLFISIKFNNRSWLVNRYDGRRIDLSNEEYYEVMWLFFANATEQIVHGLTNESIINSFSKEEILVWEMLSESLGENAKNYYKQFVLDCIGQNHNESQQILER